MNFDKGNNIEMRTDWQTKFLLTSISLGLWAVVLKPLLEPSPVHAQAKKRYEFLTRDGQNLGIGGTGSTYLDREAGAMAMNMAASKGWKVTSVNMFLDANNRAFYTIVVEK